MKSTIQTIAMLNIYMFVGLVYYTALTCLGRHNLPARKSGVSLSYLANESFCELFGIYYIRVY